MPKARIRIKPEPRLDSASEQKLATNLSTVLPVDEHRIVSLQVDENGLSIIIEIQAPDKEDELVVSDITGYLDEAPELDSYEILHADEQTVLLQYVLPVPASQQALHSSGNLPMYPLMIRDGWIIAELTTSQERLAELRDELDSAGVLFEIMSVTQSTDPSSLLTDRQYQVITEAIDQGYYEYPPECSLTDVATALDSSKSTISYLLRRAEGTIIKEFLAGPGV